MCLEQLLGNWLAADDVSTGVGLQSDLQRSSVDEIIHVLSRCLSIDLDIKNEISLIQNTAPCFWFGSLGDKGTESWL